MLRTGIILIYEIESSEINSPLTVRFKGKSLKDVIIIIIYIFFCLSPGRQKLKLHRNLTRIISQ